MQSVLLVIHVLLSLALIGLVLIQQGKGADAGAAFGGGGSNTMFGSSGAGSFLTRLTTGLAIAFFITSLGLAYISAHDTVEDKSVINQIEQTKVPESTVEAEDVGDLLLPRSDNEQDIPSPYTKEDIPVSPSTQDAPQTELNQGLPDQSDTPNQDDDLNVEEGGDAFKG